MSRFGYDESNAISQLHSVKTSQSRGRCQRNDFALPQRVCWGIALCSRTTTTPRTEGLFGFHADCDFSKIRIHSNVIECQGQPRPLLRSDQSYQSKIGNNRLINVSDVARFQNPNEEGEPGLEEALSFRCGVEGEFTVTGWDAAPTESSDSKD